MFFLLFMENFNEISEVYIETYGCSANYNSSEIMKGLIKQSGLNLTSNQELADVLIVNSCIVKGPTESKILRKLQDIHKNNPEKPVILSGCMPRLYYKKIRKMNFINPKKIYFLETRQIKNIVNLLKSIQEGIFGDSKTLSKYLQPRNEVKVSLPKISNEKTIGICQISEGCFGNCSYCITKKAKGNLYSFPKEEILNSIKNDLRSGAKEIWITSQDNASYGFDNSERVNLPDLLREILKIPGNYRVRLGMMNPDNILYFLDELIEIYKKFDDKLFKFLHLPIQSGSNKILKLMKRKYTKEDVRKIVKRFKEEIPEISISTDVIVGFPYESEEDFNETLNLIKEIKPEILNRSNFYIRPGTEAEKMYNLQSAEEKLSNEEVSERSRRLEKTHFEICRNNQKRWLGKNLKVLIDKKGWPGTFLGRTLEYKLVAVSLPRDLERKKDILGKFVNVKVVDFSPHYLVCSLV